ncbi:MAG TPA: FtsX-like permease family protein, partial [Blastocatellia bacterium]|nr:FtsX-like permease family protein [Blastocatellia bacterium]
IRIALGAGPRDVMREVVREGMTLVIAGIGLGLVAALGLTRLMAGMLYEVKPYDPLTFLAVSVLLVSVATLAEFIPARRASAVDPMVALRT